VTQSNYGATLARLFELTRFGEKTSLDGPRALNAALGDPLAAYDSVLIGGTNGKGSTAAFLEAALRAQGVRTGLFTSPHLMSFRERIRVDGQEVSSADVAAWAPEILDLAEADGASFFEAAWALAATVFARRGVEVAIWEVGLGGRLDATNVADPVASAVVSVGLDHTHILGDTHLAVAAEKAAIFRSGRPALTAATGEGLDALRAVGPAHLEVVEPRPGLSTLPLPGAHQRRNASLALALAEALGRPAPPDALNATRWPGRGERIGDVVLDCAHNEPAMAALVDWLREAELGPIHLVFGAMMGKDVGAMARHLAPVADSVVLVTPDYPRRVDAAALAAHFPGATVAGPVYAALDARPVDRITLVCGSCFLVGEARAHLLGVPFPECGLRTTAR